MKIISGKDIKRNKNWHLVLYSKPGVGKTSSVKFMNGKTLVLDLDNSSKVLSGQDVDVIVFDRVHPEEAMEEFLREAPKLVANYDNLIIDNVSSFEDDWFVEKGRSSKNGISNELQHYSQWTNYFARVMTAIYMLSNINIMTTAWEEQRQITTANGQTFNQYAPQIRDSVRDGMLGLADAVGRMMINPDTGKRGVILQGDDSMYAKNRLDNRTASSIEDLFKFGGDDHNVQTTSVSNGARQPSKK